MTDEVRFVGNIRRLRLRPGDTLVVELPGRHIESFNEAVASLRPILKEKFPDNEALFVGEGVRIGVLAK